jgi:hypothetical protein
MAEDRVLLSLRAELEAVSVERDAALSALDEARRQASDQTRLLMEEQDRFVSRLLAAQERDLGKLRLELEEAQTTAQRIERKFRADRDRVERLEDELGKARAEFERVREQRDAARAEALRGREAHAQMRARLDQLEANLALARTMLDDAMGEGPPATASFTSARPPTSAQPRGTVELTRESGFRRPQPRDIDESYPPGLVPSREPPRRGDTPRPIAAMGRAPRSRPPG